MTISKVKSVFPTYTLDDSVEEKNYHRVLFKPGVSVQARELTELQTNLQRQIDYHGQYAFKEGGRVVGGEVSLNVEYDFIKVESNMTTGGTTYNPASFISTIANAVGTTLVNDNGVEAEVIQVISEAGVDLKDGSNKTGILDSGNASDPLTLYIKYVKGSGNTDSNTFAVSEVLTSSTDTTHKLMVGGGTNTDGSGAVSTISNPIGKGSKAAINEGVYFISGNFVYVVNDNIILDKYSNSPTIIVGLNIIESIVNSTNDATLVDNAAGYPNASAPGADRYKIATKLIKADYNNPHNVYSNYITLFRIEDGIEQVEQPAMAEVNTELTQRLARRTNEESGNYALSPFILDIREHLDDGSNGGFKTADKGGSADKYVVGVEPNVAYVQGFRIENIATKYIEVEKPRSVAEPFDYSIKPNTTSPLNLGNYIKVDISSSASSVGFPDITNFSEMALIDSAGGASGAIALVDSISMTHTGTGAQQGTYYVTDGDSHTIGADGSNAKFKIIIDNQSNVTIEVIAGGSGYNVDSTFTVTGTKFTGGATTANDLTFDVAQLGHGRARCRGVTADSTNVLRLYLFDIVMTSGQFTQIDKVEQLSTVTGGGTFFANLVGASDGIRYDSENNSSLFKLPYDGVKNAQYSDRPVYQIQKRLFINDTNSTGSYTFVNALDVDETLISTSAIMSIGSGDGTDTKTESGVNITASGRDINITNSNIVDNSSLSLIINVQKSGSDVSSHLKTKTFTTVSGTQYKFDGTNPIPLNAYDIYDIVSVKQGSSTGPDITDQFQLDNGQRDNFYEEGRLIPVNTISSDDVWITFQHYTHSDGDFCTINSYIGTDSTNADHDMNDIPEFALPNGEIVDLKDCIDFRPVKGVTGIHTNVYSNINSSTFKTGGGKATSPIVPNTSLVLDAHVWMPRIDKLILSRDGDYSIKKGVTAQDPATPDDVADAMTIATLYIEPFVYNANDDITPVLNDHKRYTMEDIGEIDDRVKKLEYYSALSLLEDETLNMSIPDVSDASNTYERFKNGIFADSFKGHGNAHTSHPSYHIAVDMKRGQLRPVVDQQNVNLIRKAGDTGVTLNESLYTLPYSNRNYIVQPYATGSEFVNPYNVFTWAGTVELSPDSDEWKDTEHKPAIFINNEGAYNQFASDIASKTGVLGTIYGEWETNWTGTSNKITAEKTIREGIYKKKKRRKKRKKKKKLIGYNYKTNTTIATTKTTRQTRIGTHTSLSSDIITNKLGSKVVETNFIPFMRSRMIYFKGELLKPNTKVYAFFNGVDVTDYCAEESFLRYSKRTGVKSFRGRKKTKQHTSTSRGQLTTNSAGKIAGSFILPNNDSLKFKTGTRTFKLTDNIDNNPTEEMTFAETEYRAQGLLEVKQDTIISTKVPKLVTKEVSQNRTLQNTTYSKRSSQKTCYADPLAQTFLIDRKGGLFATEIDIFIKAKDNNIPLNVSIREVENGIPTQRIVPGSETLLYPGTSGSDANTIYNNMVTENGSVSCPVTFADPVYLAQDTEYAIVLMSNSDKYKVFVAETGKFDLMNASNRVSKQPYNGVFFTSQNASTWTPDQYRDLKFTLKRAYFTSSGATLVLNNDEVESIKIKDDPFFVCTDSTTNSAVLRVAHPNHGMVNGSTVQITGATTFNTNITATALNTTHTISDVERDSYVITVTISGSPGTLKRIGGGDDVEASENMQIDTLVPFNQSLVFPGTNITYELRGFTGQSIDSTGQSMFTEMGPIPISVNDNNHFDNPLAIASTAEHSAGTGDLENASNNIGTNKSLAITCTFSTTNSYLSPVIDADRSSLFCISNRTNNATDNSGTSAYNNEGRGRTYVDDLAPRSNSNLNNYITNEIVLANEASQLNVFMDVYKPAGSDILLYYKVQESGDDTEFDNIAWSQLDPIQPIPSDDGDISEAEYQVNLETDAPALPDTFSSFAFKIVLIANNSSKPPLVSNLRSIATT